MASVQKQTRTACQGLSSTGDGICTSLPNQSPTRLRASFRQRFLFRHQMLHGLWLELRSCYQRIRLLWKRGHGVRPYMGRVYISAPGHNLIENRTSQARIQDMQTMLEFRPWASPEDCQMFLVGWEVGRVHGVRNYDSPAEEPIGDMCLLDYLKKWLS